MSPDLVLHVLLDYFGLHFSGNIERINSSAGACGVLTVDPHQLTHHTAGVEKSPLQPVPELSLLLRITPAKSVVYTGKLDGELSHLDSKGEAHAFVSENSLALSWEWEISPTWQSGVESMGDFCKELDHAFEAHVSPVLMNALDEGRFLSRIRQINNCMILATWFEQRYWNHPNVARFLESGDPNQLSPTFRTVSTFSKDARVQHGHVDTRVAEVDWSRGIDLNNKALDLRRKGDLDEAETLMREALRFDEELRGPEDPKIPHRLNNLCTVLVMQGKLDDAKPLLARAWRLKTSQHDLTSLRLLFVRLTVALLEAQPAVVLLGQLKTLLTEASLPDYADVTKTWNISYFIEHLNAELGAQNVKFLTALAAATNDRSTISGLDQFPEWRDATPQPLD